LSSGGRNAYIEDQRYRRRREVNKVYVETSAHLLAGIDEMVKEGYYSDRTEAVNEAISMLLKQYKISKLYAKDAKNRTRSGT
jgi:Arc/MetJ-type ribon-helix-helix transcriptional regulator